MAQQIPTSCNFRRVGAGPFNLTQACTSLRHTWSQARFDLTESRCKPQAAPETRDMRSHFSQCGQPGAWAGAAARKCGAP
jgi:hypothetical protein